MRWVAGIVLGFVLGCVMGGSAQQTQVAEPSSAMDRFLREAGIRDALEHQRAQNLAFTREQIAQVVDQLSAQAQLPADFRAELQKMGDEAVENIANAYTIDEAIAVYAGAWDRNYPGDQLQLARANFATPEGKRLVSTIYESTSELTRFTQSRRQAAMQRETTRMITRMRELLKRPGASPPSS
jgi:hypothetical protein